MKIKLYKKYIKKERVSGVHNHFYIDVKQHLVAKKNQCRIGRGKTLKASCCQGGGGGGQEVDMLVLPSI